MNFLVWFSVEIGILAAVGLLVRFDSIWRVRRVVAPIGFMLILIGASLAAIFGSPWLSVLIVLQHLYMLLSLMRVYHHDALESRLRAVLIRDQAGLFAVMVCCISLQGFLGNDVSLVSRLLAGFCTTSLLLLAASMLVNMWRSRSLSKVSIPSNKLPSLTVAYAARNEQHAIGVTLELALASSYPKLEILVLDDCSSDATVPEIKKFAQRGVRFIKGEVPKPDWQPKNQALDILLEESAGEYIAFSGVDVHVSPKTLQDIIELMRYRGYDMVSVLPKRRHIDMLANLLLLPRNFWQLVLPRSRTNPATLSSFWVIRKDVLLASGGFKAVKSAPAVESYFAKWCARKGTYRFLVSDHSYGLTTRKRLSSQVETEIRNLYPLLHRSIARTSVASLVLGLLFIAPWLGVPLSQDTVARSLWCLALVIGFMLHAASYYASIPRLWPIAAFNMPFIMFAELVLLNVSMYKYEFSEVLWKGRNVCAPMQLQTIPSLPDLPDSAK